jgi:hypothetical protein
MLWRPMQACSDPRQGFIGADMKYTIGRLDLVTSTPPRNEGAGERGVEALPYVRYWPKRLRSTYTRSARAQRESLRATAHIPATAKAD